MKIIERNIIPVKAGKMDEILELAREAKPWHDERNIPLRVLTAYHAQYDVVIMEKEFESLADEEMYNKEAWADPANAEINKKFFELTERGRTGESWVLHDI